MLYINKEDAGNIIDISEVALKYLPAKFKSGLIPHTPKEIIIPDEYNDNSQEQPNGQDAGSNTGTGQLDHVQKVGDDNRPETSEGNIDTRGVQATASVQPKNNGQTKASVQPKAPEAHRRGVKR